MPSALTPRIRLAVALVLVGSMFLVWRWFTGQMWEDYLITLRHSENAATGQGLAYTPGERIHGFTSPLNVLVPAALLALRPGMSAEEVLWCYCVVGLLLMLPCIGLVGAHLQKASGGGNWAWWTFPLLLAFNEKACSFSMNGQEAAFTLAFLALAFFALWHDDGPRWPVLGVAWAGLMWNRPDAFVLIGGIALATLRFSAGTVRTRVRALFCAAGLSAVLYAPWLAFATWYYGSPIPHTILAKAQYRFADNTTLAQELARIVSSIATVLPLPFSATYSEAGGWPGLLIAVAVVMTLVSVLAWLVPWRDRIAGSASVVAAVWFAYMLFLQYRSRTFPWYFPPIALAGAIVITRLITAIASMRRPAPMGAALLAVTFVIGMAATFLQSMELTRLRQQHIEYSVRTRVGLWLKEHVAAGERVYLEPIGYIGYYSDAAILDYPGLVSPQVARVIREKRGGFATPIMALRPEWLVLRVNEVAHLKETTSVLDDYAFRIGIATGPDLLPLQLANPSYALNSDFAFAIYRRTTEPPADP